MTSEDTNAQASAAATWLAPKRETREITLPSTNKAIIKTNVSVKGMIRQGVLEGDLAEGLNLALQGKLHDLELAIEVEDVLIQEIFVSPKIWIPTYDEDGDLEPQPKGTLSIDDVDDADRKVILELAFTGVSKAHKTANDFRRKSRGAQPRADRADVVHTAEPVPGSDSDQPRSVPSGQGSRRRRR